MKFVIFLLLISLCVNGYSQIPDDVAHEAESYRFSTDTLSVNAEGKFEFAGSVQVADASATQLYNKVKLFRPAAPGSSMMRDDILTDEKAKIESKTVNDHLMFTVLKAYKIYIQFNITVQCRDNGYTYSINNFKYGLTAYVDIPFEKSSLQPSDIALIKRRAAYRSKQLIQLLKKQMDPSYQIPSTKFDRPSPPAFAKETLANGTIVSIDYSQPSLNGRIPGKSVDPFNGRVWRTGANEATVFEISKDVKVEGKALPAGKYGLFTIANGDEWTIIFNKTWNQWGAFSYKESDDILRVKVKQGKPEATTQKMTFGISKAGKVSLMWGDIQVDFLVN
jgi:hypothetical protein